jgi:hypothetical protein
MGNPIKLRVIKCNERLSPDEITLGKTITDTINGMIKITEYISYTKYAIEKHLGLNLFDPIIQKIPLTMIHLAAATVL